ncbi:hypothetical protein ACFC07_22420 [Streptomyces sp. NPDC056099]|uniref:hypothetical protein n=1 Tax=unclassified Streptomyces TaxID=2593676 RepID=UPI0035E1F62E
MTARTIPPRVRLHPFPLPVTDELLLLALRDLARNNPRPLEVVYSFRRRMNG